MSVSETPYVAPRDFDELRSAILERKATLPKRLTQVAVYALDNPDGFAFRTAANSASAASVQPSSLVRFAQSFGFEGFSSLQPIFQDRLKSRTSSYVERLRRLEGEWAGEEMLHPTPWAPGGSAQGRWTFHLDSSGRYLVHDYSEERQGGVRFDGHGVLADAA